jgi:hypothetical protein
MSRLASESSLPTATATTEAEAWQRRTPESQALPASICTTSLQERLCLAYSAGKELGARSPETHAGRSVPGKSANLLRDVGLHRSPSGVSVPQHDTGSRHGELKNSLSTLSALEPIGRYVDHTLDGRVSFGTLRKKPLSLRVLKLQPSISTAPAEEAWAFCEDSSSNGSLKEKRGPSASFKMPQAQPPLLPSPEQSVTLLNNGSYRYHFVPDHPNEESANDRPREEPVAAPANVAVQAATAGRFGVSRVMFFASGHNLRART